MPPSPRGPAPRSQPQQEGFGLIVARVAERDDVGGEVRAGALEKGVARRMRRVLERSALARARAADVFTLGEKRPAERCSDVATKRSSASADARS